MLYVFYLSFTDLQLLNTPKMVGLDNYGKVFKDPLFRTAVFNTVLYSVVVTFCQTWLALILAVVLNAKLRGKQFFRTAWYIPSVTSSVVISLIFVWVFQKQGILNYVLATLFGWTGFQPVAWLTDAGAHTALPAIMLLNILTTAPPSCSISWPALQDISEDVYEAASIDGSVACTASSRLRCPCCAHHLPRSRARHNRHAADVRPGIHNDGRRSAEPDYHDQLSDLPLGLHRLQYGLFVGAGGHSLRADFRALPGPAALIGRSNTG